MSLTLAYGGTTLALPGLHWEDEFSYQSVDQETARSITGKMIVDEMALAYGRPITLKGAVDMGWMRRGMLLTLRAWANVPGIVMAFGINGDSYSTGWRQKDTPIASEPVGFVYENPPIDARYVVTLRLFTVPPL